MAEPNAILSSFSAAIAGAAAAAAPAIVSVHSRRSRASGFVWKAGLVVTADETLADEGEVAIKLADGFTGGIQCKPTLMTVRQAHVELDPGVDLAAAKAAPAVARQRDDAEAGRSRAAFGGHDNGERAECRH